MTGEVLTETRNWAELPRDALAIILGKLSLAEMLGAVQACRSLCRPAGDVPVTIRAGSDRLLLYIAMRLPSLRRLCLVSSYSISKEGFVKAVKMLPLLEELKVSLCKNIFGEAIEAVGKSCQHLKHFRLSNDRFFCFGDEYTNDLEAWGISAIHELRSLQLFGNNLTNRGLTAILDNCPHLEFLDIRHCFNVNIDAALQAKCARIKTLRLPDDLTDDYEFEVKSPRYYSNFNYDVCEEHWDNVQSEEDEDLSPENDMSQVEDEDMLEEDMLEVDDEPVLRLEEAQKSLK